MCCLFLGFGDWYFADFAYLWVLIICVLSDFVIHATL